MTPQRVTRSSKRAKDDASVVTTKSPQVTIPKKNIVSPKTPAITRVVAEDNESSKEGIPDGIIGMKVRTPPSIAKDRWPSSQQ